MTLLGLVILLIITAVVGSIGQALGGYSRGGCLVSLIIGYIGAYLGTWLAHEFNWPPLFVVAVDGQPFPLLWAIVGSILVSAVLVFMYRSRPMYRI